MLLVLSHFLSMPYLRNNVSRSFIPQQQPKCVPEEDHHHTEQPYYINETGNTSDKVLFKVDLCLLTVLYMLESISINEYSCSKWYA